MNPMEPLSTKLDLQTGRLEPPDRTIYRRLTDMRNMFTDRDAVDQLLDTEGNRLIYEVQVARVPEDDGHVPHCTTIIYPGVVGDEFHMTKGHFHARRDRGEVYLGLAGEGMLLLQTEVGAFRAVEMRPGTIAYVPPLWAHRTVNTGDEPFVFLAAWPGDAGHDYGTIEETGFVKLLVKQNGKPTLVDNPRWTNEKSAD